MNNLEIFTKYQNEIKKILEPNRYWHSVSVALTAAHLSEIYNCDIKKCITAGLLHDYAKNKTYEEIIDECKRLNMNLTDEDIEAKGVVHGFLSAKLSKNKFGIEDDVYDAIYYHTCGRENMPMLNKIIYISDFIEPLRPFSDRVEHIRKLAYCDIDYSIILACEMTINHLKNTNSFIHSNSIKTLNYYKNIISKRNNEKK